MSKINKIEQFFDIMLMVVDTIVCGSAELLCLAAAHYCPYGWFFFFPMALGVVCINIDTIRIIKTGMEMR